MAKQLKNYEVEICAYTTVLVIGAESQEDALERAEFSVSFGDFEMEESKVKREITSPSDLERCRRLAKVVDEEG